MKKILTIDGGGIKGMYAASFLASIEKQLEDEGKEPRLYKYFDMMSGTSTGGIIAVGLALGIPAAQIASLYENKGPKIFDKHEKKSNGFWHKLKLNGRHIYKTKYTPNELHAALRDVLEDKVIGDAKTRLLIPSVHAADNTPRNFKTKHAPRFKNDHKRLAVDVCMATAAAPTFFEAHKMPAGELMVDGGIMANNPIAMATVEAIGELDWPKEDIRVLSVSCLSSPSQVPLSSGALEFLFKNLLDVTSNVASANAIGMSQILLGEYGGSGHKAIHRIDTVVDVKSFSLDATEEINKLKSLGANKGLHEYTKIQDVFFQQTVEPFIPE